MTIGHQSGSQPLRFINICSHKIIFSGTFRLIYLKDSVVVGFGNLLANNPHHTHFILDFALLKTVYDRHQPKLQMNKKMIYFTLDVVVVVAYKHCAQLFYLL